ncbi:MAG: hypothetical protein U5N86_04310 [Planctomycetota bacterium]|nr:hypothetical protein [Planctomycetota bacterium]
MDYKSLGISGEDLEVDKKVTPIRVFKGRDGAEARLFAVDAPDIKECEKIVRTFAKNRRVKGLKKFDKFWQLLP